MQFVRPFTSSDLPLFGRIRALGFDFVELLVPEPDDDLDLMAVREALEENGLDIVLAARVNLRRSLASDDPDARQGGMDYLKYCIEIAETLGARIIGGPLYGEPLVFAGRAPTPMTEDQRRAREDRTIEGLATLAPIARNAGKYLALEPLNRFETDVVSTTGQAMVVVETVNDDGLGLLLDTFHMNMEERSIPDAIRAAGSRLLHFQANENDRGYPGTGHIDWPPVMRALSEIGYDGPISLEPFRRDDDRVALPIAHWRPPHEDETDKLRAGLDFIRSSLIDAGGDQ